ncbi:MAG TPA: Cys-tRNA(Pro) deacylase, partial [Arthrobacter sp.]|nr:Cys-tRNA(Pro) deacylase [Arthrobacter sp.]
MAKHKPSAGTPATTLLQRAGVPHLLHSYSHDPSAPSFGLEAAEALGMDPDRVFKTLMATLDGSLSVAIVPVSSSLD